MTTPPEVTNCLKPHKKTLKKHVRMEATLELSNDLTFEILDFVGMFFCLLSRFIDRVSLLCEWLCSVWRMPWCFGQQPCCFRKISEVEVIRWFWEMFFFLSKVISKAIHEMYSLTPPCVVTSASLGRWDLWPCKTCHVIVAKLGFGRKIRCNNIQG